MVCNSPSATGHSDLHRLHGRSSVHGRAVFDHAAVMATAIAGNPSAVAWVYAVNSIIAVVLGYPVPRLAERRIGAPARSSPVCWLRRRDWYSSASRETRSACSSPSSSIR